MKHLFAFTTFTAISLFSCGLFAQSGKSKATKVVETNSNKAQTKHFYLDVHHIGAGKVNAAGLAEAYKKDLAVQKKYGVDIVKYWFDESKGDVYCLASSASAEDLKKT